MNTINFHGEVFATKTGSKTRDYITDYVEELFSELLQTVQGTIVQQPANDPPPPLSSSFSHLDKVEAVATFRSRFSCN